MQKPRQSFCLPSHSVKLICKNCPHTCKHVTKSNCTELFVTEIKKTQVSRGGPLTAAPFFLNERHTRTRVGFRSRTPAAARSGWSCRSLSPWSDPGRTLPERSDTTRPAAQTHTDTHGHTLVNSESDDEITC